MAEPRWLKGTLTGTCVGKPTRKRGGSGLARWYQLQLVEAEDPLELLPHGGAQAPLDGLLPRVDRGDLAEDLVGAVVAEDLGAEGGLERPGIQPEARVLVADVDEGDEGPQTAIGLKGHVLNPAFPEDYKSWQQIDPRDLIDAPLIKLRQAGSDLDFILVEGA